MAEELVQGGLSWWNSPRNFFSSSPCSNDIGWPQSHDLITETKSVRSSDESAASDGSSCLVIPDHHAIESMMPPSANPAGSWNQDLLRDSGRSEEDNYCSFLLDSSMNYRPQMNSSEEDSSMKQGFGVESLSSSSAESYSLLQTLFDTDSQPQQTPITSYPSSANYHMNSNGFLPKSANRLWNASSNLSSARPTFPPSPPSHFFASSLTNHKPNIAKQHEQGKDLATVLVKKASNEPTFKRPRIETPSPLPTFKVRKEKLGDRITALQQLVSPFGKTDTASVLHEAIEYIKFLHDQVNALSTPYLKYGSPPVQRQQGGDKSRDEGGVVKDLKTRGLCLVPISSTFPVAAETSSDFWTPTLGGSFR